MTAKTTRGPANSCVTSRPAKSLSYEAGENGVGDSPPTQLFAGSAVGGWTPWHRPALDRDSTKVTKATRDLHRALQVIIDLDHWGSTKQRFNTQTGEVQTSKARWMRSEAGYRDARYNEPYRQIDLQAHLDGKATDFYVGRLPSGRSPLSLVTLDVDAHPGKRVSNGDWAKLLVLLNEIFPSLHAEESTSGNGYHAHVLLALPSLSDTAYRAEIFARAKSLKKATRDAFPSIRFIELKGLPCLPGIREMTMGVLCRLPRELTAERLQAMTHDAATLASFDELLRRFGVSSGQEEREQNVEVIQAGEKQPFRYAEKAVKRIVALLVGKLSNKPRVQRAAACLLYDISRSQQVRDGSVGREAFLDSLRANYPDVAWSQRDWEEAKGLLVEAGLIEKTKEHVAPLAGRKGRATCYAVSIPDFWQTYCFDAHEELDIDVFFSSTAAKRCPKSIGVETPEQPVDLTGSQPTISITEPRTSGEHNGEWNIFADAWSENRFGIGIPPNSCQETTIANRQPKVARDPCIRLPHLGAVDSSALWPVEQSRRAREDQEWDDGSRGGRNPGRA